MSSQWLYRAILGVAAACLIAFRLDAALPKHDEPSQRFLTGQLIVASPGIADPRFAETVILIVHHDTDGAVGITINRPIGERTIAELLKALGQKDDGVEGSLRVFAGGPVQPWLGFIIHTPDYHLVNTNTIDGKVSLTKNPAILRDIGHHKGPAKSFVALGYAGWAGGQLEFEFGRHDWFVAPSDPALLFDEDRDKVWDDAMKKRTEEL